MDMHNILKNFDAATKGNKPSTATADKNSMKAILESLNKVTAIEECGTMPMPTQTMPEKQGNPVTMSISLNASGKENVDELMALLKGAGLAQPSATAMGPSEPPDMGALRAMVMKPDMPDMDQDEIEISKEEWDNSPDEHYSDHETMTKDLSGGINRQKKMYKPAAKGDNPMAVESVKERLWAALNEKKSKPDFLDMDKDGDKKEPMKKAVADKKGSKPKKGVNPFAKKDEKVKEGWDDMLKAAEKKKADQGTGKFDSKKTSTGTVYTRKSNTYDDGGKDADQKKADKKDKK